MPQYCQVKSCISEKTNKRTQASYGFLSDKKVIFCKEHKQHGMVDLRSNKCVDCQLENLEHIPQASYGQEGEKAIHCIKHALETDVDLKSQKCNATGCKNQAIWGVDKKVRCGEHKKEGDKNLISSFCIEIGCSITASYGYENKKKRIYCKEHSKGKDNVVNLIPYTICKHCEKEAYFGTEKLGRLVCQEHAKGYPEYINMKNLHICIEEGCKYFATFGHEKGKPLYCQTHNKDKLANVLKKHCLECDTRATFGDPKTKSILYCFTHKKPGMKDNVNKQCEVCNKVTGWIDNKKYCSGCYYELFPNSKIGKLIAYKQVTIINDLEKRLNEKFNGFSFDLKDKRIPNGSSLRRPDSMKFFETFNLIIEVDEHQHRNSRYSSEEDEYSRVEELYIDGNSKDLLVIRINPDMYISNREKVSGMFLNKSQDSSGKGKRANEYERRMLELERTVCEQIFLYKSKKEDLDKIKVIKLFFTENNIDYEEDDDYEDYVENSKEEIKIKVQKVDRVNLIFLD
jgi:hypothetical protein